MLSKIVEEHIQDILFEIKSQRLKKKIPQQKLASELGISVSSYCKFENNQLRVPYDLLLKVLKIIEVPVDKIRLPQIAGAEETNPDIMEIVKKLNAIVTMIEDQNKKIEQINTHRQWTIFS